MGQVWLHIQGDSRGKVNILEEDIIGHCQEKIISYEYVSYYKCSPRECALNLQIEKHCEW